MNFIFKHPLSLSNKLCSFQYENTGFGPGHPGHPGQIPSSRSSRSSRSNWIVGPGPGPGPGKIEIIGPGPGPGPGKLIISVPVPVPVPVRPEIMSRSITDFKDLRRQVVELLGKTLFLRSRE